MKTLNKRVIAAAFIGNALEFYDFTLFAALATVLSSQFFPAGDPIVNMITTYGIFAAGFFMRPLGGLFFGYLGDKYGRRRALSLSIMLITVPTVMMGLLPTYAQIGVTASFLLAFARMLQGFCTGGEYNGSAIFAIEHTPKEYHGLVSGLLLTSCAVGAVLATGVSYVFTQPHMPVWAWRVPVLLGTVISVIGFYIRRNLHETPEFSAYKQAVEANIKLAPRGNQKSQLGSLRKLITHIPEHFGISIILGAMNGLIIYILFGFMIGFLTKIHGISLQASLGYTFFGMLVFGAANLFFGRRTDRGVNPWVQFQQSQYVSLFAILPIFYLLNIPKPHTILIAAAALGMLAGMIAGAQHYMMYMLFPIQYRYRGTSLGFSIGMSLFGGLSSYMNLKLINAAMDTPGGLWGFVPAKYAGAVFPLVVTALGVPLFQKLMTKYRKSDLYKTFKEELEEKSRMTEFKKAS